MKPGDRIWVVFGTEPREVIAVGDTDKLQPDLYIRLPGESTTAFPVDKEYVHETKAEAYRHAFALLKVSERDIERDIQHKEEILCNIRRTLANYELEIENGGT